jgi:hypothetical protein
LTGPEVLTQAEQVATIARAVGKEMRIEELTAADARRAMLDLGADPTLADSSVAYWAASSTPPNPSPPQSPSSSADRALTFADWAREHAEEFLPNHS